MTDTPQHPKKSPFTTKLFGGSPLRPEDAEAVEAIAREWAEDLYRQEAKVRSTIPAEEATPGEFFAYHIESIATIFDVHAKRIALVAIEDRFACEKSLDHLIEHYMAICAPAEGRFGLSRRHIASEVGIKLKQRKAHWMAEALGLSRKVESTAQFQDQIEKGRKVLEEARQTLEAARGWRLKSEASTQSEAPAQTPVTDAGRLQSRAASTQPPSQKQRRGPKSDIDRHRAIAGVVKPYGDVWKSKLEEIAAVLDEQEIEASEEWAKLRPLAKSWNRAVAHHRERVIKAIDYSLKMAAKDIPEKLSEILGNSR